MAFIMAYLFIGFTTAICLFVDAADRLYFDPDSIINWTANSVAFLVAVFGWPYFMAYVRDEKP